MIRVSRNPVIFNLSLPTQPESDSVHGYLIRGGGLPVENTITLDANNTTASENIFQVTGTVAILRLYGVIVDATTLTNLTGASWDLFAAGDAAIQISANNGVLSGTGVGTMFAKTGLAADTFALNNNVSADLIEQSYEGSDVFSAFIVTQKAGVDTFIRFTYTTTDAPINAQIKFYVEYRALGDLGEGTLVAI